jgi:hypothetical protein
MTNSETQSKQSYRKGSSNQWENQVKKARAIPIQTMCQKLGIELTQGEPDREGESWWGTCPTCDDDGTSLHVSPQKSQGRGLYYCRKCGNGGDSLSLYQTVRNTSFPECVRALM